MDTVIRIVAVLSATALVFGSVVLWDKLREPHRNPGRPFAVVDERTCKIALRHVEQLEASGDLVRVQVRLISIREWLRREIKIGSPRKALQRSRRLEQVERQLEQLHVRMFGHPSGIEAS